MIIRSNARGSGGYDRSCDRNSGGIMDAFEACDEIEERSPMKRSMPQQAPMKMMSAPV